MASTQGQDSLGMEVFQPPVPLFTKAAALVHHSRDAVVQAGEAVWKVRA